MQSIFIYRFDCNHGNIKKQKTFFDYLIPQIKSIKIAVRFLTLQIYKQYFLKTNIFEKINRAGIFYSPTSLGKSQGIIF